MRRRGLRSAKLQITNHKSQILQRGYMMITLMLALAMLTIALLTVLPEMKQQILRDREEEMRHRGTAYMRAIQHYFKKYNSYPMSIEQLENTNNLRFLRKRYTDPMNRDPATGKERDFKILHQTDISLNNGPVLGPTPGGPPVQPSGLQPPTQQNGDSGNSSSSNPPSGNPTSDNPSDAGGNPNSPGSPSTSNPSSNSSSGFNGPTFGGGADHRGRQHEQREAHSRVLRKEPLQGLALHLCAAGGPRWPAERAGESWHAHWKPERRHQLGASCR